MGRQDLGERHQSARCRYGKTEYVRKERDGKSQSVQSILNKEPMSLKIIRADFEFKMEIRLRLLHVVIGPNR